MRACEDYIDLIMRSIDGETTGQEEAALHVHLQECPGCRALYEAYQSVDSAIQATEEEPPEQLTAAIMNSIHRETTHAQPRGWLHRYRFTMIAAAAAVVILVSAKVGSGYLTDYSQNTTAADAVEMEPAVPEMAAEFRAAGDTDAAGEAETEGVLQAEAEEAYAAEEPEAAGEWAAGMLQSGSARETAAQNGDSGISTVWTDALEAAGFTGEALRVSGSSSALLEAIPDAVVHTLDNGETAYEVSQSAMDELLDQGEFQIVERYAAQQPADVYWVIFES